jgi:hypothetical protein
LTDSIRRLRLPDLRAVGRAAELVALVALCLFSIRHWLGRVNLSPDSTTYLTTSGNWIRTGRLFYFTNAASWSMEPEVEPYTEQPPGFVYFLAPFVLSVPDSIDAALVGQCVAILLFFAALYGLLLRLRIDILLRLAALGIFAFLAPFVQIRSFLWSETLFIAVCLATGWLAVRLALEGGRAGDWLFLAALLAAGSAIRLAGPANLLWITPILLRRRHLRAGVRLLVNRWISLSLFAAGAVTILLFLFADRLGLGTRGGIGPTQLAGIAVGVGAVGVGAAAWVLVRKGRVAAWSAAADAGPGGQDLWPWLAVVACVSPILIWFARNEILFGAVSLTNKAFEVFHPDHMLVPITYYMGEILDVRLIPRALVALSVLGLLVAPLMLRSGWRRTAHLCLVAAGLGQLASVWIPSLASQISGLGDRLLSPTTALMTLACLHGLQSVVEALAPRRWARILVIAPFLFLALGKDVVPTEVLADPGRIAYPIERDLWDEVHQVEALRSSTHFYSDRDFNHQIFSGIPQRILWDTTILRDPAAVGALLETGNRPFFLLREGSWEAGRLEELMASGQVPLEKTDFAGYGFVLYYGLD